LKALILSDPPLPGALNMAVDMCLMGMAEKGEIDLALRTYQWQPHGVSLGRLQKGFANLDRHRLSRDGIDLVRRPTGGRAVWHGRELTYSVTSGAGHPLFRDGVEKSLGVVAAMLLSALNRLGVPGVVNRSEGSRGFGRGPCFTSHGKFEIMTRDGRKLVGSAQARTGGAFLEHGSILFDNDQPRILDYTTDMDRERTLELKMEIESGTGTVREFQPDASPENLAKLLRESFTESFHVTAQTADYTSLPGEELRHLALECGL